MQLTNFREVYVMLPIMTKHLNVGVGEYSRVLALTRKKSKFKTATVVKNHKLFCDHVVSLKDFKLLARNDSEFLRQIKEIISILRNKPELKRNEKPLPLYLFD